VPTTFGLQVQAEVSIKKLGDGFFAVGNAETPGQPARPFKPVAGERDLFAAVRSHLGLAERTRAPRKAKAATAPKK
jgi:hypothetical protein